MVMCMCMLNKRTHILFDKEYWEKLTALAKKQNTSVGRLVRQSIEKTYFSEEEDIKKQRAEAVKGIKEFREKYAKKYTKGEDSVTIIQRMRDTHYGKDGTKYNP